MDKDLAERLKAEINYIVSHGIYCCYELCETKRHLLVQELIHKINDCFDENIAVKRG